jgi:hypothetical protein
MGPKAHREGAAGEGEPAACFFLAQLAPLIGHCNVSLLVLAQRRDVIPYSLSGLSDAVEVAIVRQFGRDPPSAVDDQTIGLRATHQLVESARIE